MEPGGEARLAGPKLTPVGRTAFTDHLAALREIVETPTDPST